MYSVFYFFSNVLHSISVFKKPETKEGEEEVEVEKEEKNTSNRGKGPYLGNLVDHLLKSMSQLNAGEQRNKRKPQERIGI